jgi:hypothetical protein
VLRALLGLHRTMSDLLRRKRRRRGSDKDGVGSLNMRDEPSCILYFADVSRDDDRYNCDASHLQQCK